MLRVVDRLRFLKPIGFVDRWRSTRVLIKLFNFKALYFNLYSAFHVTIEYDIEYK